jgi:hypothetical protein
MERVIAHCSPETSIRLNSPGRAVSVLDTVKAASVRPIWVMMTGPRGVSSTIMAEARLVSVIEQRVHQMYSHPAPSALRAVRHIRW